MELAHGSDERGSKAPETLSMTYAEIKAKYGMYPRKRTKTYRSWESMKQRCLNPKFSSYHWYGGRGVIICERWLGEDGFKNFLADMGEVPNGLTLERIDNNGNYEPSNCRWATRKDQCRNRKTSAFLTFNGRTQSVAAWAEELGIPAGTIHSRRYKGRTDKEAIFGR